jgi:integrase/recombinase XerD
MGPRRKVVHTGGARARTLPQTLGKDEVAALMSRPNVNCPTGLRNRAMLAVMLRCGLRVSEVCGIYLRDVDWRAAEIRLRPEVAKGGREAVVYIDDPTLDWLQRWKAIRRPYAAGAPFLFVTLTGKRIDRHYVWEMTSRYARRAGIERKVWPHLLRHTFATSLLEEGFNIAEVQELMRHSNIQTTSVYLHVRDMELKAKVRDRTT